VIAKIMELLLSNLRAFRYSSALKCLELAFLVIILDVNLFKSFISLILKGT
jgi:hypothetical protein